MRILLVSPYHGGSHRAWAEGYRDHSTHQVMLLTLPARFWKWRMHGGAVTLGRRWLQETAAEAPPDLILSTDLLDLTTFLALTRRRTAGVPVALYMHENQLTYPLPVDPTTGPMRRQLGERDRHYAFINYVSMLAADSVFFNSHYHLDNFFAALPAFLRHYPEYNEMDSVDLLRHKSDVLPVGVDLQRFDPPPEPESSAAPLVLWNQRLEYDKNPEAFIAVLTALADEGLPFRVALCGERFGQPGESWEEGVATLGERVIHNGFADDARYRELLWEATVTLSTASHEYFGISILEAIHCRTFPLLPARLSYPELIPPDFHADCLYHGRADLLKRLRWALTDSDAARNVAERLAPSAGRFDWDALAPAYDEQFERLAQ